QLEVQQSQTTSLDPVEQMPVRTTPSSWSLSPPGGGAGGGRSTLRVEDVARGRRGWMRGEVDRYNMKRGVNVTGHISGEDLGSVARQVDKALKAAGDPPRGATVEVRGQVAPLRQMFGGLAGGGLFEGLTGGLILAVAVILLLLTAYFQSLRLALVVVSTPPPVLPGGSRPL